jgi:hypothetical protein
MTSDTPLLGGGVVHSQDFDEIQNGCFNLYESSFAPGLQGHEREIRRIYRSLTKYL